MCVRLCDNALSVASWQTDRSQLNHNWLQNVVLVGLRHALEIVAGGVRPHGVHRALSADVLRWAVRGQETRRLLLRFEEEMSPRLFFDVPPLSRCSLETKGWLVPVTHQLWLSRERVADGIAAGLAAYDAVEHAYGAVAAALQALPDAMTAEDLREFRVPLETFAAACESLSHAISDLPRRITCF
jgi:hypothetical protein